MSCTATCELAARRPAPRPHASTAEGRSGTQGLPIAFKDILCVRGEETTAGSRILEGHRPLYDAGAVSRARSAGLISLGKTNMDEFAMGSSTEHSAFGPTHNPWDTRLVPGGSSGGSAAAVAAARLHWRWAPTPAARSVSRPPSAASSA